MMLLLPTMEEWIVVLSYLSHMLRESHLFVLLFLMSVANLDSFPFGHSCPGVCKLSLIILSFS